MKPATKIHAMCIAIEEHFGKDVISGTKNKNSNDKIFRASCLAAIRSIYPNQDHVLGSLFDIGSIKDYVSAGKVEGITGEAYAVCQKTMEDLAELEGEWSECNNFLFKNHPFTHCLGLSYEFET